jgi:hypothetical protein
LGSGIRDRYKSRILDPGYTSRIRNTSGDLSLKVSCKCAIPESSYIMATNFFEILS